MTGQGNLTGVTKEGMALRDTANEVAQGMNKDKVTLGSDSRTDKGDTKAEPWGHSDIGMTKL